MPGRVFRDPEVDGGGGCGVNIRGAKTVIAWERLALVELVED
jgi:hypothetical protein